jgi:hypothetical protein
MSAVAAVLLRGGEQVNTKKSVKTTLYLIICGRDRE